VSFLTNEQSRVAFIGTLAALFGTVIGGCLALEGTHMTLAENRKVQLQAVRRQAYTQLMGEKAELLMLLQELTQAHDKDTFYQGRAAQLAVAAKSRPAPSKATDDPQSYLAEAVQQERNADHYSDEVVACNQKVFESIALIQLSFPADPELDSRIAAVQAMLTRTDDVVPTESLRQRMAWVVSTEDAEQQLSIRQKQRMVYIEQAVRPITDLLTYLKPVLAKDS
jgi:hypothetical protein